MPSYDKESSHYNSGEKVQPGDTVECADGMKGEVTMVFTPPDPGGEIISGQFFETLPGGLAGFMVQKSDGTSTHYPPSNPSVRLLSRAPSIASGTMNSTIKKDKFLQLLDDLNSHTLYYPVPLSKKLSDCGVTTVAAPDGQGIILEGNLIELSTPEWGEPGISPLEVLRIVYEIATGEQPNCRLSGRGFWYRAVIRQLKEYWGLDAND
jgi:hypothetical protein